MMSFKEFKTTICTAKVAGPQKEIKTTATTKNSDSAKDHNLILPTTSATAAAAAASSLSPVSNASSSLSSSAAATTNLKMSKLFTFIDDTYRDIRRYNSGLYKNSYSSQLMLSINKYKNGCNEIFGKVLESYDMSLKLSQNIVRTLDIFKQLSSCLSDLEEYQYRVCEIMSIFIVCELRLSVDAANTPQEQLAIAHRIIYIMRRHLVQEEEAATLYNILRTLVYIPKLYNARDIMCAIFGEFIPIKPVAEVNVLPDKLYMLYIIVFYRWMMMQKDNDDKLLIVNFAESFMKPSVSLCSNNLYGSYLPMYTTHSTATRTILNNLKFYRDIRNACIIDNALKTIGSIVNLCDDDEDDDVIIVEASSSPANDFAQIFANAQLEPLNGSLSNIKLEEKTVIGTVDLTMEEEATNAQSSIVERHDKWLNDFQQLAKQYREAQLLLEKQQQQSNQLISNREKEDVICLDSDSESEEEISNVVSKEKTTTAVAAATTVTESSKASIQNKPCEDLFVDSYPLTTTPIHCDTDLESLEAEDNDDVTKISSRFLSGTLRTYQAKKSSNLSETEDKNNSDATDNQESYARSPDLDKAYRRDSIHISSSPPEGLDDEEEHDEDDGTDVQDEHDDEDDDALNDKEAAEEEEANAYTFLPTASKKTEKEIFAKQIRPMGPYPTYNMHANDKVVFSQTLTRYPHTHQQDKQYYSDSSEAKTPKKQKKRVQFNTSPLGPTVPANTQKLPLKPALQQQKYKASDAPEYFHLRGFERFSCAASVAGSSTSNSTSSSIKQQEQQESTKQKCNNKQEIVKYTINNNNKLKDHNNKCSNFNKNLSVFNQKSLKQKTLRNVKINLKRLRLNNDISLTNFKSNSSKEQQSQQPLINTTLNLSNNSNSNNNNESTYKRTETCQLKTNPIAQTSQQSEDDIIFKKPLPPVTKKVFKSSHKPLKIHKVVSLRRQQLQPYHVKPKEVIKCETSSSKVVEENKVLLLSIKQEKPDDNLVIEKQAIVEQVMATAAAADDSEMDDLTKISKLLTEEINSLTCDETVKTRESKESNDLLISHEMSEKSLDKEKEKESISLKEAEPKDVPVVGNNLETNQQLPDVSCTNLDIPAEDNTETNEVNINPINVLEEKEFGKQHSNSENVNETLETPLNVKEKEENILNDLQPKENPAKELTEEHPKESPMEQEENLQANDNEAKDEVEPISERKTKDGDTTQQTDTKDQAQDQQISNKELEDNTLESAETPEEEDRTETAKLVTNFCAEFLAGLQNEPHTLNEASGEAEEGDCESKNDFEFENNCSTPLSMCHIDLDVMTENTSELPATQLVTEACEAAKLLEDFNNKTEDIVDSALNKRALDNNEEAIFNTIAQKELVNTDANRESLKRLREEDEIQQLELMIESSKKSKVNETNEENLKSKKPFTTSCNPEDTEQITEIQAESVITKTFEEKTLNEVKETKISSMDVVVAHTSNKESNVSTKSVNELGEVSPKSLKKLKTNNTNPDSTHKEIKEQQTKEKKLKKSSKSSKAQEKFPISPKTEDTKEEHEEKSVSNESSLNISDKKETEPSQEHSPNEEVMTTQQVEDSLNENQHMTLELGNWNKDMENETKTNDSDTQGVSAIFSFPKIPIISISICTTPNNKTYFKISNRENDKQHKEGAGKSKKVKTQQQDTEAETKNEEKLVSSSSMETNEIVKNKEEIKENVKDFNEEEEEEDVEDKDDEEEEEETEEEEEETEEECDNMEIEKFSHDSNSACSLPLKKRPTQAEPNEETEDTQFTLPTTYEQPQEIAAEVVIEDSDKDKEIVMETNHPPSLQIATQTEIKETSEQDLQLTEEINKSAENENQASDAMLLPNTPDYDDNKPSTSAASLRKLSDPSSPFKRRVHMPVRAIGQPPIQIVAPQLKDNPTPCLTQDNRPMDTQQLPTVARSMQTQNTQPLPESYPATPMLSVANVEKLMDLNRFIEDLLASPDVMTIIDNANACGYYAEGQAYEMERIAILEHYNIANAKGSTSVTKPLYWKKSAGDTISIFNDNDNEWIALPPSTAKQLLKLSFVLSILQQQYKVSDVRQRINIALTFLIQTSYTSKFKNNSKAASSLQQRMQLYSRTISEATNTNHNITQPLPSASYFRIATNNEALNTNFNISHNINIDSVQDFSAPNYSNSQTQNEMSSLNQEPVVGSNQNWNSLMQFSTAVTGQVIEQTTNNSPQRLGNNSVEVEQQQPQQAQQDKRNPATWDELNNDQLYINPPCATSPQNEVIVNTNGVQLHEMPQNFQDQQNILISITDESVNDNGSLHKYNTRQQHHQQQQQQQHLRALEDGGGDVSSSTQQYQAKRPCLGSTNATNLMQHHFARNNIINTFGNQEINLQNPYRLQQQQQQQQQQSLHLNVATSPSTNFPTQRNISPQNLGHNLPINIYNNNRSTATPLATQQQRMNTRYSSTFNAPTPTPTPAATNQQTSNKNPESNYKEILQPYITYLIKDHEKTSKHLLQVFEEVSNSQSSNTTEQNPNSSNPNNCNQQQQPQTQFTSLLPPLIRNPQQNHMPGLHQMPGSSGTVLPSLIRNPHQTTMPHRDSGALQLVQSFLDQTQTSYEQQATTSATSSSASSSSPLIKPGFVKEYVNFVGSRDEVLQKQKLSLLEQQPPQQQQDHQQQQHQQLRQDTTQRLNSVKRKCQERNDKLAEDLKRKMMEFSLLKHNVQVKILEKQQQQQDQQQTVQTKDINATPKRRGRPKKNLNKLYCQDAMQQTTSPASSMCNSDSSCEATTTTTSPTTSKRSKQSSARVTRQHLAAAATLFRNIFDRPRVPYPYSGPFSPSSSSLSSHPPTPSSTANRKKSRLPKNKKPPPSRRSTMGNREDLSNRAPLESNNKEGFSIIRNREVLNDGYHSTGPPGMPSYQESSDEFYGVVSDSDIVNNERYRNDTKLRKRCAVVITPTKELIQYERKRDQMYNEILLKQRQKLELRALEKQREKERRRRLTRRGEESAEQIKPIEKAASSTDIQRDRDKKLRRKSRNYTEIFMSSESEFETNFQVRTRKQTQQNVKDLQPLNIQIDMNEATTNTLLSQIDAHLDEPKKQNEKLQEERTKVKDDLVNEAVNKEDDIKQKTCDINNDKGGQTKMRELNLLADIAQHLSPYQLDLPETNTTPAPLTQPTTEAEKEKVTVTEHIILQQSFDNLLEKSQTQTPPLDINNEPQPAATTTPSPPSYAHESKLLTAANNNSSPTANVVLPQQNNTPNPNENNENSTAELNNDDSAKTKQIDETLEQILEESISVLKSVTSPGNLLNESSSGNTRAQTPPPPVPAGPAIAPNSETTIPILISNVKSLNNFEQEQKKDTSVREKFEDKTQHLVAKETVTMENGLVMAPANEKPMEILQATIAKESQTTCILSSTILNNTDTSLDLSNISSETEISQALKVPPSLMTADLSDISLESEIISKHLPDIAEPSPVVTDMSDNSNESNVSKVFHLGDTTTTTTTTMEAVMSLPVLPLEMPQVPNNTPAAAAMESNFNNINTTLNTPTKLAANLTNQLAPQTINELNTPLKFPLQPDLVNEETAVPVRNVLEPETDNNVTKFLDLILNKTVTDAESETRDKIIKELNALTADSSATVTDNNSENKSNEEITTTAAPVAEIASELTATMGNKPLEVVATDLVKQATQAEEDEQVKGEKSMLNISLESLQTVEDGRETVKETQTNEEQPINPAPSNSTEELNPPNEEQTPLTKPLMKINNSPLKQTFNIKCRVRLKRLNIDDHCKSSKKETWMAIPLTKTPEMAADKSANNNDMKNCDNTKAALSMPETTTTTPTLVKKPNLKINSKRLMEEQQEVEVANKNQEEQAAATNTKAEETPTAAKRAKLEEEQIITALETSPLQVQGSTTSMTNTALSAVSLSNTKNKTKPLKTVTFDLSNLNEELRDTTSTSCATTYQTPKHKTKNHAAGGVGMGCYLKNNRTHKKLPDNTLRAAETLQLFVNTINESTRTPPAAEYNKKRSPIKNKCIAEDETPRPPPASTLMGTPPCKKSCSDKARSQISSTKCKDQLVSSLPAPPSISTITSDITTARIYTSSPLDQTLPEYDDNVVDTVADTELILPTTTGSLRRKLKRPKKSLTRTVEPADDTSTDDISNQPECNGEDDTDAVVDNEDDVFAEELLPIPAANEHILEEIVSARPTHMGTGTVIRDDYMNIEATATVPVYLFNDESSDLATPEPIQSSSGDTTNVVDSSSYLNNNSSSSPAAHNSNNNVMATATASTTSSSSSSSSATTTALGNLEKSMLSPSEHEVSSTQETFYQTPTKSKQNGETFSEKSSSTTTKDKAGAGAMGGSSSCSMIGGQKLKPEDISFQKKQQEDHTSSTTGLLQNNQVDTTNHSPEMCTLALTPTTTSTSTSLANNRKMRKVSTHDEILFNELQQQQQQQLQQQSATNKRQTTFCAESTSDHNNCKTKVLNSKPEDSVKSNGGLNKEDKFKKLLKEACKRDKNLSANELEVGGSLLGGGGNIVAAGGGGGSSPSTTTIINEDKVSRSKRKKQKSSKSSSSSSSKSKNHNEKCTTKIVLKASKLSAHVPTANPLIITIPKSRILRPPAAPTPPTPVEDELPQEEMEEFLDIPNAKLFTEKDNNTMLGQNSGSSSNHLQQQSQQHYHHHQQQHHLSSPSKQAQTLNSITKKEWHQTKAVAATPTKTKRSHSPVNNLTETLSISKSSNTNVKPTKEDTRNSTSNKDKSSVTITTKNSLTELKTTSNSGSKVIETKEKSTGSSTAIKKKTKNSSSNSHSSSSSNSINNLNSSSSNSNLDLFVKDKYDLIKSKEKSHHHTNDLSENKEKLKDKSNSQPSSKTANTNSSSNSRLHKSSSKEKLKDKHKINEKSSTQTQNPLKFHISLSSSSSSKNSANAASNSNKSSNSKSSKSSSSTNTSASTLANTNTILKTKTNLSTQTQSLNDNNNASMQQQLMPTTSSTSTTGSLSSNNTINTSATISTHHVRKKLKTK